jgi:AraC-like DNA-binding protein
LLTLLFRIKKTIRIAKSQTTNAFSYLKGTNNKMDKINAVIKYIEQHYHDEICNTHVEALTGCSFSNFSDEFQRVTGIQFLRYLIRRQLTLIKEDLCRPDDSKEINYSPFNGWDEFSNLFKCEFKTTVDSAINNEHIILQERGSRGIPHD